MMIYVIGIGSFALKDSEGNITLQCARLNSSWKDSWTVITKKEKIIGEKGSQNGTKVKKENLCSILRLQRLMKNIC